MNRFLLAAALAAICIAPASAKPHEDPVASAPGHDLYGDPSAPDISGLWFGSLPLAPGAHPQQPPEPRTLIQWFPWPPPLTPTYQKMMDERVETMKAGHHSASDIGLRCLPFGMPRMLAGTQYPDEIIETPGVVSLMIFGTFPIMIWTDGRPHPRDLKPSYNGHSVGRWDGDTLVVDTVGILPATTVENDQLTPHSAKLHIVTMIQKVNADTLHFHMTLYDEDAFTEPMTITNILRRKSGPKWQVLDDISCFENNANIATHQPSPEGFVRF